MPGLGPIELIVVLVIAAIVVGPKRLPGLARSLGKGVRSFKETVSDNDPRKAIADATRLDDDDDEDEDDEDKDEGEKPRR
jgi:sec-independent protein translocase protein TatA